MDLDFKGNFTYGDVPVPMHIVESGPAVRAAWKDGVQAALEFKAVEEAPTTFQVGQRIQGVDSSGDPASGVVTKVGCTLCDDYHTDSYRIVTRESARLA